MGLGSTARAEEAENRGAAIYQKLCASCHGDKGQGVQDKYDEPLHGNRGVEALAKRIARTMPDDDVGACVGEDARQVAAYIYDAFYSPRAQWRLRPPEFDLARLTNAQFRTSVADLMGLFRGGSDRAPGDQRGLKAHYTGQQLEEFGPQLPPEKDDDKRREREKKERVTFDRVDEKIDFHFGEHSPDAERMRDDAFNIRWDGSILAPETGVYEFVVKTENGVRLSINNPKTPLIDAWVTSGPAVREEKKSIFLLGGRTYPFSVEHFKFHDKTASIEVRWKPPHGVEEIIPRAQLLPQGFPVGMAVKTTFPPDDRSAGYERGTSVSKEWDEAVTGAAIDVAEDIQDHLDELAGTKSGAPPIASRSCGNSPSVLPKERFGAPSMPARRSASSSGSLRPRKAPSSR